MAGHIGEIIKMPIDLSCVSDRLVHRLAEVGDSKQPAIHRPVVVARARVMTSSATALPNREVGDRRTPVTPSRYSHTKPSQAKPNPNPNPNPKNK